MPRLAVLPVGGALGLDDVRRDPQRDYPVGRTAASGDPRVAVLDDDVIAEEPRRLGAGVADQGLAVVEFQSEGLPEELRQPGLDLPGFGLRPDKTQYVIICVPCVFKAAVTGVHRVVTGERAQLLEQVAGFCPVPALPGALQPHGRPVVFRVEPAASSARILRDQLLLDEFVELVQVNVTEDWGHRAALRNSAERVMIFPFFEVPGLQHVAHQPEEPVVVDFLRHYPEQDLVVK